MGVSLLCLFLAAVLCDVPSAEQQRPPHLLPDVWLVSAFPTCAHKLQHIFTFPILHNQKLHFYHTQHLHPFSHVKIHNFRVSVYTTVTLLMSYISHAPYLFDTLRVMNYPALWGPAIGAHISTYTWNFTSLIPYQSVYTILAHMYILMAFCLPSIRLGAWIILRCGVPPLATAGARQTTSALRTGPWLTISIITIRGLRLLHRVLGTILITWRQKR